MKKLKFYFAGLAIVSMTFFACNNDDENNGGDSFDDSELLRTSAVIDKINEEDFQLAFETANDESALESRVSQATASSISCATVTQTSVGTGFPMTFQVDFGAGCTHNGVTRSGMLTITYTGFFLSAGSEIIIERTDYKVNGYEVEGTVTYENLTANPDTPQWSRTVTNGQITTPGGDVYTHSGSRVVKQIEGVGTPFVIADNVFEVSTGNATVTRQGGSTLNATITTPLIKSATCDNISQGVLHLEGGMLNGDLNYGDGDCDNTAIYTHSDGMQYTVILN